jgi:hypothetical protein
MNDPDPTLQPERVLWLHVIAQALIDAASKDPAIKKEVKAWLQTEDFEVVCGMAGMRPEWVKSAATAILRDRQQRRAFKKAMSFRFLVRSFVDRHTGSVDKRGGLEE